jgi:hypothetical protein
LFENISNEIQNLESIGKCGGKEINAGKGQWSVWYEC